MKYGITDLIDVEKTQKLLQNFFEMTGIPAAIIDLDGIVLVTSNWRRICTDFHRQNEKTCKRCIESDTILANSLLEGKPFSLYCCPNGLVDAASPIVIEGKHLANLFIGQFLAEEPDVEFFRRQAQELGFEEKAYLDALSEVPVVPEESLPPMLSFLTSFAEMIGSLGLKQLRQLEVEAELRTARGELELRVEERTRELSRANRKLEEEIEERKRVQRHTQSSNQILRLMAEASSRHEFLERIVTLVKEWTGCRCVGIRVVDSEGNIPYGAYTGFDGEFWEKENWLSITRDSCACTRVIAGEPEPQDACCMTANGSFILNDSRKLVESLSEEELGRFRGACIGAGFRSIAVVPIRESGHTIAGIHIADEREGMVPDTQISFLEGLSRLIGEGIIKYSAKDTLEKQRELLQNIINRIPVMLYSSDAQGTPLLVNPEFERLLGWSLEDANKADLLAECHPDSEYRGEVLDYMLKGSAEWREFTVRTRQGDFIETTWSNVCLKDGSHIGIGIDLRERKRAERIILEQAKQLEAFFSHTITPLVFLDKQFNFIRVNEAYAKACGKKVEDFPGHNHFELYPHAENQEIFSKVVKTKQPYQVVAKPFIFPDHPEWGVTYWDWSLIPILNDAGEVDFLVFSLMDATNRERAQEELREKAALLDLAHDAILVRDIEDRVAFWNKGAEKTYGWTKEEALGKTFFSLLQTRFPTSFDDLADLVLKTGEWEGELEHKTRSGDSITVASRWALRRDASGNPTGFLEINRDITEKKKAEQALMESEALLRKVLETLPVGVWITDKSGKIVSINHMGQWIWGGAKYVGIDQYGEYKGWWADTGKPIEAEEWAAARAITKGETSLNEMVEIERFDGTRKIILNSAAPIIGVKQEIMGAITVNLDITELRKAQNALRESQEVLEKTFESIEDAIMLVDPATRVILSCNSACSRVFGYSREEIVGQNIEFLHVSQDMYERFGRELYQNLDAQGVFRTEFRMRRKDGAIFPTEHTVTEILDASGRRDKVVALIRDITERHEAQEKIGIYTRKLEQSNQALQDFASIASHDMKEPLRKILSFGNQLQSKHQDSLSDTGRNYLERMMKSASRMDMLLNSLLEYSRVTTKAEPFILVNLESLIRDVLDDLEVRIVDTGGRVELGNLPTVEADPHQMRQLFQNLIANALKYHGEAKPVVRIHGEPLVGGKRWRIEVSDNGIGFDQKYADRIFAPFQRLHGRNEFEGVGMGLSISKKIVEKHGGNITARGIPGRGATFTIELPVKQTA